MLEHGRPAEDPAAGHVLAVAVGVGERVQPAADHGLGLVRLGHDDCLEALVLLADVDVAAEEVDEVRPLQQDLRHPGVVVPGLRHVAVDARLGLLPTHGVREVRVEGLAAVPLAGDGLLLRVDPLAVQVLRAHQHRARRAHGRDAVPLHGPVAPQHEDVVAQHLVVVLRPVAREVALVVEQRPALVGAHGQVAAEAARHP